MRHFYVIARLTGFLYESEAKYVPVPDRENSWKEGFEMKTIFVLVTWHILKRTLMEQT